MFRQWVLTGMLLCFLAWGCNNNQGPFISLVDTSVSPSSVVEGNSTSISFFWEVKFWAQEGMYHLSVYLSRDQTIDKGDLLVFSNNFSSQEGSLVIDSNSLSVTPGKFYLIFKASVEDSIQDLQIEPFTIQAPERNWTVMVYMAGDNDLSIKKPSISSALSDDIEEMEEVGSSDDVNVLTLADTFLGTASLYYVKPGEAEELTDMGEVDMAQGETLVNFVKWISDVFPAKHYLLILWDHGEGFKKARAFTRDLLLDEHPLTDHWMDIPTLALALDDIISYLGRPIDILGFDACLMNMFEIAYEIRDKASFMVGSENWEDVEGWPYDLFLSWLVENSTATPQKLAEKIVESYISYYAFKPPATMAAVDLSKLEGLLESFNTLVNALTNETSQNSTVGEILRTQIFLNVQRFDDGNEWGISPDDDTFVDLYHLAELINEDLPIFSPEAEGVEQSLNSTIIAKGNVGEEVKNAYGLSIWFPDPSIYNSDEWEYYWDHYSSLQFFTDSSWPDFLTILWGL